MEAIALRTPQNDLFQTRGRVLCLSDSEFLVETPEGRLRALRAASCLLAPEPGDDVLLAGDRAGGFFVLAVLVRAGEHPGRITAEGDLVVELESGRFTVAAKDGVNLVSPEAVSISAGRLEAHAGESSFVLGTVKLLSNAVDTVLDRVSQRIKTSLRRVDGLDQVRSGEVDYKAEAMMRLHGENTMMTASKLVKANGKQVHIG